MRFKLIDLICVALLAPASAVAQVDNSVNRGLSSLYTISFFDFSALLIFAMCWFGYAIFAEKHAKQPSLMSTLYDFRKQWMLQMQKRDNRIVDTSALNNLLQPCTFFASTTIFILGGVIALLAAPDTLVSIVSNLPFARESIRLLWEMKIFLLIAIFAYGFFKFTWAMRQYTTCTVLVVSAPPQNAAPEEYLIHVERASRVASFAGENFNLGVRAYYFGFAAISWFWHPAALIVSVLWVTYVVYQREFNSRVLLALLAGNDATPRP